MHPLRFAKLWFTLGWLLIALIVFLSLWPEPPQPLDFEQSDKFAHIVAYMILMLWFANLYPQSYHHVRLGTAFFAMGICLELLQGMIENRTFSYADILANGCGIVLALFLAKTYFATWLSRVDTWLAQFGSRPT